MRSELWDLSLYFAVFRKVWHFTVSLQRVRLLFSFTCVFIDFYSLGTSFIV